MKVWMSVLILLPLFSNSVLAEKVWPMEVVGEGYEIKVYQPQPQVLKDGVLSARLALGITRPSTNAAVYGAGYFSANISNDVANAMVLLQDIHVSRVELPNATGRELHRLTMLLANTASGWEFQVPADVFERSLALEVQDEEGAEPLPQSTSAPRDASLTVEYDGVPRFVPIPHTSLCYADNSSFQVIQDGTDYYCAERGVWFVADNPEGPWCTADKLPDEIERIPPSSPVHNTRFLYVGTQSEDEVQFKFHPGYLHAPHRWHRLHGWAVDYESPDYSIRADPYAGYIYYRDKSSGSPKKSGKNWGRDTSKFPDIK